MQNPILSRGRRVPQSHSLSSFFQLRSALDKTEELEVSNGHLVKRLEKMKANRNALLSQQ
ncbi:Leucine-rich repeat flightless-interacting protein 2 [Cricetulus griseus]|uniref:Leucine-rich repeat flightless-interacting protein 2 n=1 Tax=Cricetulus griseus TaxID=10029 RepID=G3IIZ9_CRIGR|nr:Leucine-rich repeat flightless-interacting protein 2 [Cricetulus griseus]